MEETDEEVALDANEFLMALVMAIQEMAAKNPAFAEFNKTLHEQCKGLAEHLSGKQVSDNPTFSLDS